MNSPLTVMQSHNSQQRSTPLILESLPNQPITDAGTPKRTKMQIDLMLLAIEALNLRGSEDILAVAKELELDDIIKNRVTLWRMRSTNPLRRFSQRQPLAQEEAKALVLIGCHLTRRLTVPIRQLLMDYQQLQQKQVPLDHHLRLSDYLERFRVHFRSRMNPRRTAVLAYKTDEKLNELALELLAKLLFCTGTSGMQRFWISLFDGEVL